MAALAVTSGIGALNGCTLVTTEVARAAANDGLFPRAFAWTDRKDTAWFGVVMAALLPSLLMLWSYSTKTGLTVFTDLVNLTVVTVAIPYLFSACAQGLPGVQAPPGAGLAAGRAAATSGCPWASRAASGTSGSTCCCRTR